MQCPACETEIRYCTDCSEEALGVRGTTSESLRESAPASLEPAGPGNRSRWFVASGASGILITSVGLYMYLITAQRSSLHRIILCVGVLTLVVSIILLTRVWSKTHLTSLISSSLVLIVCSIMAGNNAPMGWGYIATAFFWWTSFVALIVIFTNVLPGKQSAGTSHLRQYMQNSISMAPHASRKPTAAAPLAFEHDGGKSGTFSSRLMWAAIVSAVIFFRQSPED